MTAAPKIMQKSTKVRTPNRLQRGKAKSSRCRSSFRSIPDIALHRNVNKEEMEMILAARRKKRAMKAKQNAKKSKQKSMKSRVLTSKKFHAVLPEEHLNASGRKNYEFLIRKWMKTVKAEYVTKLEESDYDSDRTLDRDEVAEILAARKQKAIETGIDFSELDKPMLFKEQSDENPGDLLNLNKVRAIFNGDKKNDQNHSKKAEILDENHQKAKICRLQIKTRVISDSESDLENYKNKKKTHVISDSDIELVNYKPKKTRVIYDSDSDLEHYKKAPVISDSDSDLENCKNKKAPVISSSDSDLENCKRTGSSKSNAGSENENTDNRPVCKYGDDCYRKNSDHFKSFAHKRSIEEKNLASTSQDSSPKMKKVEEMAKNLLGTSVNEFSFFLTTVKGIPEKFNKTIAYGIKDLLSLSKSKLKASAQFNYLFDIPWLIEQYPQESRNCPLTIIHGEQLKAKKLLETAGARYPNIKFCQAKLDIPFGTHHTKMMFLLYEKSLRIIIHTSNIIDGDWAQKTQGMWVSPLFPRLKEPSLTEGESVTGFKADIIEYVSAYKAKNLEEWCLALKQHDLSEAKIFVIGSVPGRHVGFKKTAFGHLKLRKVLNKNGPTSEVVSNQWPIIGQFSSIGSLGTSSDQWMCGEWLASLSTIKGKSSLIQSSSLKLVYPSVENVRKSLEGYPAGASLPYSIKVASKQPYLKNFLHQWKSEQVSRSEASPHIKTYLRLSPSSEKIAWFLVTSANLSKAAWGVLEKKDSQLMIRSFEIGVLFLPEYFGKQFFDIPKETKENGSPFLVPFDLPLSKYNEKDEPWIWDIPYVYAPDRNGNKWCPS